MSNDDFYGKGHVFRIRVVLSVKLFYSSRIQTYNKNFSFFMLHCLWCHVARLQQEINFSCTMKNYPLHGKLRGLRQAWL